MEKHTLQYLLNMKLPRKLKKKVSKDFQSKGITNKDFKISIVNNNYDVKIYLMKTYRKFYSENPIKKELQKIIDNSDLTKIIAYKETSKGVFKAIQKSK